MPPRLAVVPPDRARGRGGRLAPCAVAAAAEVVGIPVHRTGDVNASSSMAALHARRPDLLVVVAFGQILGKEVLALPRLGAVNLHFSLLPRWRGAAPVQRTLEAGDGTTGVTVQRIVRKLDAGPVLARRETEVLPGERAGELEGRLADLGAALLADIVSHAADTGALIGGKQQDPDLVTFARKVRKEEGRADFGLEPEGFCRRARALHPWPTVSAVVTGAGGSAERLSFHRVLPGRAGGVAEPPGTVLAAGREGIEVSCGGGSVRIAELQRPGGRPLPAAAFLNGFPLPAGARLSG